MKYRILLVFAVVVLLNFFFLGWTYNRRPDCPQCPSNTAQFIKPFPPTPNPIDVNININNKLAEDDSHFVTGFQEPRPPVPPPPQCTPSPADPPHSILSSHLGLCPTLPLSLNIRPQRPEDLHSEGRVERWWQGYMAAISFTFDDGSDSDFTGVPFTFEKFGYRTTVYCFLRFVDPYDEHARTFDLLRWPWVRRMHRLGHELGTHTASHRSLTKISMEEVDEEFSTTARRLKEELGLPRDYSFTTSYPAGDTNGNIAQLSAKYHLSSRTIRCYVESYSPNDWHNLAGCALNQGYKPETLFAKLPGLERSGDWHISFSHGYDSCGNVTIPEGRHCHEGYKPLESASLDQILGHLRQEDKFWVAPLGHVARYIKARDATTVLKVESIGSNLTRVVVQCSKLPPQPVPLTVSIRLNSLFRSGCAYDEHTGTSLHLSLHAARDPITSNLVEIRANVEVLLRDCFHPSSFVMYLTDEESTRAALPLPMPLPHIPSGQIPQYLLKKDNDGVASELVRSPLPNCLEIADESVPRYDIANRQWVYFLKIPKSGTTAFRGQGEKYLPRRCPFKNGYTQFHDGVDPQRQLLEWDQTSDCRLVVHEGKLNFSSFPSAPLVFAVIREPINQFVSALRHDIQMHGVADFDDKMRKLDSGQYQGYPYPDMTARRLDLQNVSSLGYVEGHALIKRTLNRLAVVGITEHMDASLCLFLYQFEKMKEFRRVCTGCDKAGYTEVVPYVNVRGLSQSVNLSVKQLRRVFEITAVDRRIYSAALQLFVERVTKVERETGVKILCE